MKVPAKAAAAAILMVSACPASAFASEPGTVVPRLLDVGVGAAALALAVVMLLDVLALRRVASGAAIAENVSYVAAGVICLAASVLSEWFTRFAPVELTEITGLAADLLVIAAMAFLAVYFFRVRSAMVRFLGTFAEEEALVRAQVHQEERLGRHDA